MVVGKWVEKREKVGGKIVLYTGKCAVWGFAQKYTRDLHGVLQIVLHEFSTTWTQKLLAIDFLLDFFDLVAEGEIEFEIVFDFFDAMHNGSVIFDADFGGDFVGAEAEFFG